MDTALGTDAKLAALEQLLLSYGRVTIGFSGGVDSTFLAAVCARTMPDRTVLVHLETPFIGSPERASFEREATRFGLPVITVELNPLDDEAVAANSPDRCYLCKRTGFSRILDVAREHGCDAVLDGSNADDAGDFRPGMRALQELGVHSPLMETGWHKDEERELLRAWGHTVWNLPAGACLATRIPCGERLTAAKLDLVRAAEDCLHRLGAHQVRARLFDGTLQIEAAPDDLARLAPGSAPRTDGSVELPPAVLSALRDAGAAAIDPLARPYRHGRTSVQ